MKDIYLSKNLKLSECVKSEAALRAGLDNWPESSDIICNLKNVAINVWQPVRDHYKIPMAPTSGYRSVEVNRLIGGSKTSQHVKGEALDFEVPGVSNFEVATWIRDNCEFDQLILEFYTPGVPNSGWIHASYREGANRKECLTFDGKTFLKGLVQ